MLKGVTIRLLTRTQTGVDAFDRPVYSETPVEIENVLVGEPTAADIPSTLDLTGRKAVYVLGIPKGDANVWENCRVELPEPFAGVYRVIGIPTAGIEENIPLRWNRKVLVERYG